MKIEHTCMDGVLRITPKRFADARGVFFETWNHAAFAATGIDVSFVQDNCSISTAANTIRGLHLQIGHDAQAKLVRPVRGRILDVVVDLRPQSDTYGKWATFTLDAGVGEQLFVSAGFAHGFRTIDADTEVSYKVSSPYMSTSERGIHWRDANLAINWGATEQDAILSERDANLPDMAALLDELGQTMPSNPGPAQPTQSSIAQ